MRRRQPVLLGLAVLCRNFVKDTSAAANSPGDDEEPLRHVNGEHIWLAREPA
jgi:hypothetical protein